MHCFSLDSLLSPVAGAFAKDGFCRLKPLPFGAAALLALEMQKRLKKHVVLIAETSLLMEQMRHNLDVFAEDANDLIFDFPPFEGNAPDRESDPLREGQRLRTLAGLGIHAQKGHAQSVSTEASTATPDKARPPQELQKHFLINTCIQALMQRIAPPSTLASMSFSLSAGAELEPEKLAAWLEKCSYDFTGEVQEPGQAARRGGLLDVWPPADPYPLRIEFDGARIESIRSFDPVDQRSFAKKENFILLPASENIKSGSTVAGRGLSAIALATAGEAGLPGATPFDKLRTGAPGYKTRPWRRKFFRFSRKVSAAGNDLFLGRKMSARTGKGLPELRRLQLSRRPVRKGSRGHGPNRSNRFLPRTGRNNFRERTPAMFLPPSFITNCRFAAD